MTITWDEAKREANLGKHGLDFADAARVFAGAIIEFEDDRFDYGEIRMVAIGLLGMQVVVIVWALQGDEQRIISMRKAEKGEARDYFEEIAGH